MNVGEDAAYPKASCRGLFLVRALNRALRLQIALPPHFRISALLFFPSSLASLI
jgi:hypothetical protein